MDATFFSWDHVNKMKPHFRSLRHFIQARKAYLNSIPVRVDSECFDKGPYDYLRRSFSYRTNRGVVIDLPDTLPGR